MDEESLEEEAVEAELAVVVVVGMLVVAKRKEIAALDVVLDIVVLKMELLNDELEELVVFLMVKGSELTPSSGRPL